MNELEGDGAVGRVGKAHQRAAWKRVAQPMGRVARAVAVDVLVAVGSGARANELLPCALARSGLGNKDRAFATELVYGTVRMRRACDFLVDSFLDGRELEPAVRAAARAGAYQLAFMRVPPYAAVSETVSVCPSRARPLLNAVLRRVANLVGSSQVEWPDVATQLSYPDWLVEKLSCDLGRARALAALAKMNEPASACYRADGYVQDRGSQSLCEHLAGLMAETGRGRRGGPGQLVLDVCAAPGGKATALSGASRLVVASDLARRRLGRVVANAGRLGLQNVAAVLADGTAPPYRAASFDLVLVDAPCSGLGVLRRRPDARWRLRPEDIERLALLQRRLVLSAAALVAPGGLLAYSVCTLTKEETTGLDDWFAAQVACSAHWEPAGPPPAPWEPLGRGAVLLPQAAGTDGMYLLVLRRV